MSNDPFSLDDEPGNGGPSISEMARAQAAPEPAFLNALNPEQDMAVRTVDGPVLVLSGAGTGKTRVLTARLSYILMTQRARPWQILAVTFTNKAAREMRLRVADMIGPMAEQVWLGTFHALGVRILRRHAELVGLQSNFTILDTDDQVRLLKQVMESEGIDQKRWPAKNLMGIIQRWKDRAVGPDKVGNDDSSEFAGGRAAKIYGIYQERLKTLNACDFGDLLLHCVTLFQNNPDVLADYQNQFLYVMVDEYQDTNVAQYLWLRLLTGKHKNICCVGDDDQSIYSWRGAEVANILKFEKDFPGAKIVRLESNYRSTPHILGAASHLIAHNEGRLGKDLRAAGHQGEGMGEKVIVNGVWDGEEEARWIVDEVEMLQRKGEHLNEVAVLVRAGFQTREFEERLITTGVPYRVVGGPRFYERMEIRDALAYMRCVVQPSDDLAFERIVNKPKRGLGDATLQVLHSIARTQNVSLMEATAQAVETDELKPKPRNTLRSLLDDFSRWRDALRGLPHPEVAEMILDESGYTEMWQRDKSPEAPGRLENLKEFIAGLNEFESLPGFLEHVSLVMENDEAEDVEKVSLMTLHAAKGLEFDVVFLPGWEEGLFPHQRALDETGQRGLEEERRLAYVGITRARRKLFITFAANRRIYNQWQSAIPSRFVDELPRDHVEVASSTGYGQDRSGGWNSGGYGGGFGGGDSFSAPRRTTSPQVIDADVWSSSGSDSSAFSKGERVFHQKFGYGFIRAVEGGKLTVAFDKAGTKKVMEGFVEKA